MEGETVTVFRVDTHTHTHAHVHSFQSVDVKVTNLRASINVPYQTMVVSPDLVHRSEYTTTLNSQR